MSLLEKISSLNSALIKYETNGSLSEVLECFIKVGEELQRHKPSKKQIAEIKAQLTATRFNDPNIEQIIRVCAANEFFEAKIMTNVLSKFRVDSRYYSKVFTHLLGITSPLAEALKFYSVHLLPDESSRLPADINTIEEGFVAKAQEFIEEHYQRRILDLYYKDWQTYIAYLEKLISNNPKLELTNEQCLPSPAILSKEKSDSAILAKKSFLEQLRGELLNLQNQLNVVKQEPAEQLSVIENEIMQIEQQVEKLNFTHKNLSEQIVTINLKSSQLTTKIKEKQAENFSTNEKLKKIADEITKTSGALDQALVAKQSMLSEIKKTQATVESLLKLKQKMEQNKSNENKITQLEEQLAQEENEIATLEKEVETLQVAVENAVAELEKVNLRAKNLQTSYEELKLSLKQELKVENIEQSYSEKLQEVKDDEAKIIKNDEELEQIKLRMDSYQRYLREQQSRHGFDSKQAWLDVLTSYIPLKKVDPEALKKQNDVDQARIKELQTAREIIMDKLSKAIKQAEAFEVALAKLTVSNGEYEKAIQEGRDINDRTVKKQKEFVAVKELLSEKKSTLSTDKLKLEELKEKQTKKVSSLESNSKSLKKSQDKLFEQRKALSSLEAEIDGLSTKLSSLKEEQSKANEFLLESNQELEKFETAIKQNTDVISDAQTNFQSALDKLQIASVRLAAKKEEKVQAEQKNQARQSTIEALVLNIQTKKQEEVEALKHYTEAFKAKYRDAGILIEKHQKLVELRDAVKNVAATDTAIASSDKIMRDAVKVIAQDRDTAGMKFLHGLALVLGCFVGYTEAKVIYSLCTAGCLWKWSSPKGPILDANEKRMALLRPFIAQPVTTTAPSAA